MTVIRIAFSFHVRLFGGIFRQEVIGHFTILVLAVAVRVDDVGTARTKACDGFRYKVEGHGKEAEITVGLNGRPLSFPRNGGHSRQSFR
jgi:hypothetical protein